MAHENWVNERVSDHVIPLKFEKPVPTQDSITTCLVMESSCSSSLQSTLNVSLKKSRRWRRNCILKEINRSHVDCHKLAPCSRGSLLSVTCRSICNRSQNRINRSTRDDQGTKVTQNSSQNRIKESMRDNQRINKGDSELQKSTAQRYYRAMVPFCLRNHRRSRASSGESRYFHDQLFSPGRKHFNKDT